MVLDEPNSNLDDSGEYALMLALRKLKEKGITVLFITHKQNILSLADKLVVMKEGSLLYYDERDKVLQALSVNKTAALPKKQ